MFLPASVPVSRVTVSPVWFSDHCQVQVVFSVEAPIFGRGFWKLNVNILGDLSFREAFKSHYEIWGDLKPYFGSLVEWLVAWDNSRPKAETLPAHFQHAVKWSRRHTECLEGLLCMDHRALYRTLVAKRGPVGIYGVGPVAALWDSRGVLIKSNMDWGVGGVVSRVRADLRKRFDFDVDKYGFHASQ
ncbi:unnamed protein product [Coregonus sp. 'balchen']|nr:unnamed protein product [Coregonus sp. 'balchen']